MTKPEDRWPMPRYGAPPKDYMHALGIISLNYNSYEHGLYAIFRPHMIKLRMPSALCELLFGQLNGHQQVEAIKETYKFCEKDAEVIDCVNHLLSHFAWCFEARNLLLHSHQNMWAWDPSYDEFGRLSFAKRSGKNFSKLNFMYLNLNDLRAIADHMYEGYQYLLDLFMYLEVREGKIPAEMLDLIPKSLPRKPHIPDKIKLRDSPVANEDTSS